MAETSWVRVSGADPAGSLRAGVGTCVAPQRTTGRVRVRRQLHAALGAAYREHPNASRSGEAGWHAIYPIFLCVTSYLALCRRD